MMAKREEAQQPGITRPKERLAKRYKKTSDGRRNQQLKELLAKNAITQETHHEEKDQPVSSPSTAHDEIEGE